MLLRFGAICAILVSAVDKDDWRLSEDVILSPANTVHSTNVTGKYCSGKNIHVGSHPFTSVKQHGCVNKCAPGGSNTAAPECDGWIAAYDDHDATDVVCLAQEECLDLCKSLAECHSITSPRIRIITSGAI